MAKVAFVQNLWYEYLGPMYISAVLKKNGHKCEVFIENGSPDDLVNDIIKASADIVAFSCLTGSYRWALKIAKQLKNKADILILFGGIHPTICPEIIENESVDIVCRGEGESSVLELADAVDKSADITNIENLWVKIDKRIIRNRIRPLLENLDNLPFPDRLLYKKYPFFSKQTTWHFIASRGCIYRCSYCYNHINEKLYNAGKLYFRQRSADNVISELKQVLALLPLKTVFFADDIFWPDKKQLLAFLEKYSQDIGLPFVCTITPHQADEDVVRRLKSCGCYAVGLAVETGNEKLRRNILKKHTADEEYVRTAGLLHKHGLRFATLTMIGLPDENVDLAIESIKMNWKIKPFYAWASVFQPFPDTDLTQYALERGFINENDPFKISMSFYAPSLLKQPQIKELMNLHRLFFYAVKIPGSLPLIKILIKLPPNIMFDLLFLLHYSFYLLAIQRLSLSQVVRNFPCFIRNNYDTENTIDPFKGKRFV